MLARIFPRQPDNASYRGHWLGILLLAPVVLVRAIQGFNCIAMTHMTATSADGIPLDSYPPAAGETVTSLFALLGVSLLLMGLLGIVILVRYRALIPFAYLFMLLDYAGSRAIVVWHPIARAGAHTVVGFPIATVVGFSILALLVVGFAFSLTERQAKESPGHALDTRRHSCAQTAE